MQEIYPLIAIMAVMSPVSIKAHYRCSEGIYHGECKHSNHALKIQADYFGQSRSCHKVLRSVFVIHMQQNQRQHDHYHLPKKAKIQRYHEQTLLSIVEPAF